MITSKKTNGAYGEIGFIKAKQDDGSYKDIEYQYDNKGNLIFEKGFTRSKEGVLPLVINGIGKPLKDYDIGGNTYQSDGVLPDTPQEVVGCGDFDESTGKYKISVVTRGKNLFDKDDAEDIIDNCYINQSGETIASSGWYMSGLIKVDSSTTYRYAYNQDAGNKYTAPTVAYYGIDKSFLGVATHSGTVQSFNFKTPANAVYVRVPVSKIEKEQAQLELGTKATSYEPYHEPITTPIYLDSPLYKIGDYSDSISMTEEVRVIKELVLTGEEPWEFRTGEPDNIYFFTYSDMNIAPVAGVGVSNGYLHTSGESYGTLLNNEFIFGNTTFGVRDTRFSNSVYNFKSYLAAQYNNGTPVKVYYVLATPEVTEVDAVEIPTLDGTTVIDVDTEVKPSNMWVEYKSSTSEYNPVALRTADSNTIQTADGENLMTRS